MLDGAEALALPTKFGQDLICEPDKTGNFNWKSYDNDGSIWFEGVFSIKSIIQNRNESDNPVQNTLIGILHQAYLLNPSFLLDSQGMNISTHLTFPRNWGLGTSSTLINNIAQLFQVDAFVLLKNSFSGSGYDIANAQNSCPILYRLENEKPIVTEVDFNPDFKNNLFFVYLNKKQSSKAAIATYYSKQQNISKYIKRIDNITHQILKVRDIQSFASLMYNHEVLMSDVLEMQTVQEKLFPDYDGVIKSLGAWGGDFVLVICDTNPKDYFISKGFETILTYNEMIL